MSSTNDLDSDDIENVTAIRMEDVQPRRNATCEVIAVSQDSSSSEDEVRFVCSIEDKTECNLDNDDYSDDYIIDDNDDDSNIGSMVSIHSEEVVWDESEMIVPDIVNVVNNNEQLRDNKKSNAPESWPTLEILPGGIIKNADKLKDTMYLDEDLSVPTCEKIFACAKCPQKFQHLYALVQHVKSHNNNNNCEKEKKIIKAIPALSAKQKSTKPKKKQISKYITLVKVKQKTHKVPKKSIQYV